MPADMSSPSSGPLMSNSCRRAVSPRQLRRLWYGIAASGLFMLTACAEGSQRPDYDAWHQSISALSLGPTGWLQTLSFILLGAIIVSTVFVWSRILAGGTGAAAFPALIGLSGVSLIICGIFPQDPAPGYDPMQLHLTAPTVPGLIHLGFAAVAAFSSVASLFVMARRFRGDTAWRGWSAYSIVVAVAMLVCALTYGIWSRAATGYAGTFERLVLLLPALWCMTFVWRLGKGVPFMQHPAPAHAGVDIVS